MLYAIGDIHGQIDELKNALKLIENDGGKNAKIVFIGDYNDRGPDSCSVINTLMKAKKIGKPWIFLRGNHDRMLTWYLEDQPRHDPNLYHGLTWFHPRLGGETTLLSYGVDINQERRSGEIHKEARQKIPKDHIDFLNSMPLTHETADLVFVHAGIRPGIELANQAENDFLWIRDEFINSCLNHGRLIVHGHTVVDIPTHFGNRVNLDGGAGFGCPLVPVKFKGRDSWLITDKGNLPMEPQH
ncbi:MAG: metallophosphoesterase family protein [Proteobacteria bacterium]|jgi:serine/threonine protein phosphatase 1|nr:metallophosphoesterase family protein [Pseudomonadota bacterium]